MAIADRATTAGNGSAEGARATMGALRRRQLRRDPRSVASLHVTRPFDDENDIRHSSNAVVHVLIVFFNRGVAGRTRQLGGAFFIGVSRDSQRCFSRPVAESKVLTRRSFLTVDFSGRLLYVPVMSAAIDSAGPKWRYSLDLEFD